MNLVSFHANLAEQDEIARDRIPIEALKDRNIVPLAQNTLLA